MFRKQTQLSERQQAMIDANAGCLVAMLAVFVLPFVAGCMFFIVLGVTEGGKQARLNTTAVQISATIISSRVGTSSTRTGPGSSSTTSTSYPVLVEYTYEFDGAQHTGERVWAVPESLNDRAEAKAVASRFPAGRTVNGFVDPNDPAESFLEKRWSFMPYVGALAGSTMLCLIAAGGVFVLGWRWIGAFVWIAVLSSLVGISVVVWVGQLWLVQVPAASRPTWITVAVGAGGFVALLPTVLLFKARAGARLYREALGTSAEREPQP